MSSLLEVGQGVPEGVDVADDVAKLDNFLSRVEDIGTPEREISIDRMIK